MSSSAEQASARTTRSVTKVPMSVQDIVQGAVGLHAVSAGKRQGFCKSAPKRAVRHSSSIDTRYWAQLWAVQNFLYVIIILI